MAEIATTGDLPGLLLSMNGDLFWGVFLLAVGLITMVVIAWRVGRGPDFGRTTIADAFRAREADAGARQWDPSSEVGILETTTVDSEELGPLAKLPPFRPIAISLLRLFDRDDVKVAEIARLVESDPSMASEMLALVNSPLFGFQGKVTSPIHAVTLLGVNQTKSLAASLAMRSMVEGSPRTPVVRRFWTHSIATATVAQQFAPMFAIDPHLAHICGLMHDLGRLGLLGAYSDEYSRMALGAHENVEEILALEEGGFGMTHCRAGALLARAWSLPKPLRDVCEHHHEQSNDLKIVSLIQLCCRLADDLMFQSIHNSDVHTPEETIRKYAPAQIRDRLIGSLETVQTAVLVAIRTLDF